MRQGDGVLFLIADLGSGGAQQVLCQIANHWAGGGRRVGVATFAEKNTDFFKLDSRVERIVMGGIAVSETPAQKLRNNFARIRAIRRALERFNGGTAIAFIAPMNILTLIGGRGLGYRIIVSERNDPARQSFGRSWDWLRRRLYKRADLVTANSRGALETLAGFVSPEKLAYLPNPLRLAPDAAEPGLERGPVFLNVGRLHEQKGQDLLIRAFAAIAPVLPEWRLVIIGEGDARVPLEALAAELGVAERVELTGRIDDPFPWYRRAGIFVFPSRWEGFPNALMEAMSCGLPAIVSDATPGPLELVRDGEAGLVTQGENVDALADAMKRLAGDAEERRRMCNEARRRVEPYALDNVLAAWDRVILPSQSGNRAE